MLVPHALQRPSLASNLQRPPLLGSTRRIGNRRSICKRLTSTSGGPGDAKKDNANKTKADTSSYWALKARELFSPRKKYLDQANKGRASDEDDEPEIFKQMQRSLDEDIARLEALKVQDLADRKADNAARLADKGDDMPKRVAAANLAIRRLRGDKSEEVPPPPTSEQVMAHDVRSARAELDSASVQASWQLTALRMQRLVFQTVTLPITTIVALRAKWQALFTTKRYENFLMAEGERIWYWRNRTENERWFFEIFAWDRLVFPIICAVSYQFLVPDNFVWAVIFPVTFVFWETGKVPDMWDLDFWLIAYFGFWRKCWPQFYAMLVNLLTWS